MALLTAGVMQKADCLRRKQNVDLQLMMHQDNKSRKADQIKNLQKDCARVTKAQEAWNSAVKTDLEKNNTAKRTAVINSADWKFAVNCGVRDGESSVYKIDNISASCTLSFGNPYSEADNAFLDKLQSEEAQEDIEVEALNSQASLLDAQYKSLDQLVQNEAQDSPLWAIGGG